MPHRFFVAALLSTLIASSPAVAQAPVLKFASFPPPQGALNKDVLDPWAKAVNEAAAGKAEVKLFAGGSLGRNPVQQYKLVRDKVADIAYVVMGYTPGDFPDATIFELPFLIESSVEGSVGHWRMHEKGLMRGYDTVKVLGLFSIPPQSLHTTFPITGIDDLKGKKIRAAGPYQSAAIAILGGTPISGIPVSGVAEALSRGVAEGVLSDWNGMVAFRIGAVAKNHFEAPFGTAAAGIFMNVESYKGLPADVRAAIDRLSGDVMSRNHGVEFDARYKENLEAARKDKDHSFYALSAAERESIKKRLEPITQKWLQDNAEGKSRYDALTAILADIRSKR